MTYYYSPSTFLVHGVQLPNCKPITNIIHNVIIEEIRFKYRVRYFEDSVYPYLEVTIGNHAVRFYEDEILIIDTLPSRSRSRSPQCIIRPYAQFTSIQDIVKELYGE